MNFFLIIVIFGYICYIFELEFLEVCYIIVVKYCYVIMFDEASVITSGQ